MARRPSERVAGVDGCRSGWVLAEVRGRGEPGPALATVPRFADVLSMVEDRSLSRVVVDMPIGLPAAGARACDIAARRVIGARRSSVFPAPARAALGARTYPAALAASRAATGRGLSKQCFFLLDKIAEIDGLIDPAMQSQVVEGHPEVSFATMGGGPLARKASADGRQQRRALLARHLGLQRSLPPPAGVAGHDALDAMALAWTARRMHAGTAIRLGDASLDERGLVMQIVV